MFKIKENKIRLTHDEEFQLLKMVLDKLLWIGTIISLYGLYELVNQDSPVELGLGILAAGVFMLFIFTSIIAKNIHKK